MKKKILIVNKSFELGGIQHALVNMLKALQLINNNIQIDLLIFNNDDVCKNQIPVDIKILKPSLLVKTMGMSFSRVLETKNIIQIIFKILSTAWSKVFGNSLPISIAFLFQKKLKEHYDYAVAYHHETNKKTMVSGFVRFILKKCDSDVKMGWIHSDFVATGLGTKQNRRIYSQLDKIICVSKATKTSFLSLFPELESKCDYCYNYLPVDEIRKKSLSESISFGCDEGVVFFSACRFVAEKGIERTIMAMLPLWKEGLKFKWYIAGNGIEYAKIEHLIHNYNIHDKVILLGYKENPYPYMKAADWFLLPSYHETFSMVAAESMIVGTPVLATDLPVVRELIDENSGYICHNSVEGIKDAIKDIVSQKKSIKVQLRENLVNSKGQFERIFQ